MDIKTVIFIGPQGSGKGTQIEKLKGVLEARDRRRVVDIQTGRRFRALAATQETFAEDKIAATLNSGILQPDFITTVLWGRAMLDQLDDKSHLLIDGFPRTVGQIPDLDDAFHFFDRTLIDVVNLSTPEEVVRARMESRARLDDTNDSIEERLRWYREETLPVIEYYRNRPQTRVHDIDGTLSIDEVHTAIIAALALE
ncbi:MAG: nucleoside monophosphate kinase [Candidatus Pacebacteria bacterium]|jgi:adenylate kinase|nr:nucleoside monophosphate kinase [Candidatus Paceibacterota bacterium]